MGISITEFKGNVADLARPNRFLVSFDYAAGNTEWDPTMQYLCQSSSIPGRTIGDLNVNWQGMQIKLAGDPTFDDIELKFLNDYDWKVRDFFEDWLQNIAMMATNNRTSHEAYKATVQLMQIGRTGEPIVTYILEGAYPKSLSAIGLDMGSTDSAEDFTVSFRYDYFFRTDSNGAAIESA